MEEVDFSELLRDCKDGAADTPVCINSTFRYEGYSLLDKFGMNLNKATSDDDLDGLLISRKV